MDTEIAVRLATLNDLKEICGIVSNAIQTMESCRIFQWDAHYPNEDTLRDDILKRQMFITHIDSQIASFFVLNKEYDAQYENGNWKYTGSAFAIVHRLCVNPQFQNRRIGTRTMMTLENMLKQEKTEAIRLDVFSENPYALHMYKELDYVYAGEAQWRKGLFYLYEKLL